MSEWDEKRVVKIEVELEFYRDRCSALSDLYLELKGEMEGVKKSSHTMVIPTQMLGEGEDTSKSMTLEDFDASAEEEFMTDRTFEDLMEKIEKDKERDNSLGKEGVKN